MQNDPSMNAGPDETPSPQRGAQEKPAQQSSVNPYIEPAYQESVPQSGSIPATPPPGYAQSGSISQPPGYVPPPAQPGYIPMTPPPGYVPLPPGYVPPSDITMPLMQWPVPPRPRRLGGLAIAGIVLAAVVVLAVMFATISLARVPGSTPTPTTHAPASTPAGQLGKPTSAFQAAPCPFQPGAGIVEGQQLSCGYVTVPEDRGTNDGKTVRLAVAIFRSPKYLHSVDPDPVLRLEGGPGGPSLSDWAQYVTAANYNSLFFKYFDHDLIMFDQRGTGYSTPSLKCPELIALQQDSAAGSQQTYEQAAQACYTRLVSSGIDLSSFNTLQNAADVADIVHALGYKQMTIYGVSYGTRLALTVMRLYPSVVHAVVLDSVYPPQDNRTQLPSDAQRVFTVLFQGCARDPNCNARYPNLQSVFYNLVAQLNAHPISFSTVDLTTNKQYTISSFAGDDLVGWLFSSLYATSIIPALPQTIYQIKNHDYTQLSEIYGEVGFDDTISDGLFYSTECSEDYPFITQQDITNSEQGVAPQIAKVLGQEGEEEEYNVCQFWKVQPVPAAQKQPVVSSLPTLVLAGEYDPITPPSNAQDTASHLSHSYLFTFPGQGHGQEYSSDCSDQIIAAFEDNPYQAPDSSCISQMTEPAFL